MDPVDPKAGGVMRQAAGLLASELDGEQRFCLLVFPSGDLAGRRMSYFSNASAPEMLAALKEAVAMIEGLIPPDGEEIH